MSGRRRRGDGWADGHPDARDERRDPWADSSVDEWGDRGSDSAADAGWSDSAVDAAWANASAGGYGAAPSYGGQRERGPANGYGANGPGAAGYNGGYQDSGYGRAGYGGSRHDAAGYGAVPGGERNGSVGGRNGSGYAGNGRPGSSAYVPEFTPAGNADMDEDGPATTPRPYGRLSIYTLHEDKTREFDRLAERAAEGVRTAEPDTLVYVIHVVPKAPLQRIVYEIYRDRDAFLTHERQPHIRQFAADRASCVLATNVIDLRLKYAKVSALGPAAEPPLPPQANRMPRMPEPAAGNDRYQSASGQYPAKPQQPAQYSAAQYAQGQRAGAVASFTPAKDQYADAGQPTVGREAYRPAAQYGAAGYANDGSYSSASGYQSANGYQADNGYAEESGSRYANGSSNSAARNGYSATNGYANGGSYQNGNGYSAANGYPNGGRYQNGNSYGAARYGSNDAAAQGLQYTPRYRELTSGGSDGGTGGYPDNGGRNADDSQSNRPQQAEHAPRPQDQE